MPDWDGIRYDAWATRDDPGYDAPDHESTNISCPHCGGVINLTINVEED